MVETDYSNILNLAVDTIMVLGPVVGFLIQASKIKETGTSEGFSRIIMLILLIANILRIFFWIGKRFAYVLLLQSLVMIVAQLYLLYISIRYSDDYKASIKSSKQRQEISEELSILHRFAPPNILNLSEFWQWIHLSDYIYFLIIFILFISSLSNIIGFENETYTEVLGYLAAGVEATLGLPQVYSNLKEGSTGSLSVAMIIIWLFGDSAKTIYFYSKNSPSQLIYCGLFQLFIDVVIILQIVKYASKESDRCVENSKKKSKKTAKYHQLDSSDSGAENNSILRDEDCQV